MNYLTDATISLNELLSSIEDPRAGAVVTFEGRVRDHNEGKPVTKLFYEAAERLAENEAFKIIDEAKERFAILHVALQHRTGDIPIGELAVFVGVSSPHRDAAFQACRYIIDEVKTRLPIWKKESYADGTSVWVNCQSCHAIHHTEHKLEEIEHEQAYR